MNDTTVTIAIVAPQEPFEQYDMFWEGAWSAAYELAPLGVRVLTVASGTLNADEQELALRDLLNEQVQAIVLVPAHARRLDSLIQQHGAKNTPVVTALNDAPNSRRMAFVGSDFRLAGNLAGELMSKMVRPRGHIVALTEPHKSPAETQRYEGFMEALRESKSPLGVTDLTDPEMFASILGGGGQKFDGLYIGCPETVPMQKILENVKPPACCITFGLTDTVKPFLASGTVTAVVDSSCYQQGFIAVQKAYECLLNNSLDTAWVPIPSTVVMASHLKAHREHSSANSIFETLVHQRTLQLRNYKQALEAANARLMRMAETDPLTDAWNRRKFEEIVDAEIAKGGPLSVMVLEIDEFQSLNDLLGVSAGDQVLKAVADTLHSHCSGLDAVARLGGDEFAVVLPGIGAAAAFQMRDRLIGAIRDARVAGHPDIRLSSSIGVAAVPGPSKTAAELIDAAQGNLYAPKRGKRTLLRRLPMVG